MRYGRLGQPQQLGNVAHAQFRLKQGIQDLDPGGVAEYLEQFRQVIQVLIAGHLGQHLLHRLLMHTEEAAAFHIPLVCHVHPSKTNI